MSEMKKANFEYRDLAYEIFEGKFCNTICEYRHYAIGSGECQRCDYFQGKFPGNIIRCSHPEPEKEIPFVKVRCDKVGFSLYENSWEETIMPLWIDATWRLAAAIPDCRWVTCDRDRDREVQFCDQAFKPIFRENSGYWTVNYAAKGSNFRIPESIAPTDFATAIYEIRRV